MTVRGSEHASACDKTIYLSPIVQDADTPGHPHWCLDGATRPGSVIYTPMPAHPPTVPAWVAGPDLWLGGPPSNSLASFCNFAILQTPPQAAIQTLVTTSASRVSSSFLYHPSPQRAASSGRSRAALACCAGSECVKTIACNQSGMFGAVECID